MKNFWRLLLVTVLIDITTLENNLTIPGKAKEYSLHNIAISFLPINPEDIVTSTGKGAHCSMHVITKY
jgi:hypothetical protein